MSKDRDSNSLVMFSSSKALRSIEKREVMTQMLAIIRDDTWNELNMQCYLVIPGGGT